MELKELSRRISRYRANVENLQLENCNKKCDGDMEQGVTNCYEIFNTCLENVPAKEKLYQEGPRYEACVDSHDFCLDCCYFDLTGCQDACQAAYGKKEK